MSKWVNTSLDRLGRDRVSLAGQSVPTFKLCGYTGLFLAFVQSAVLIRHHQLSQLVLLGMTAVVVVTFFSLVMATKIITGEEQIIYYHHEIAVMTMLALFLRIMHQPLLPYLDIAILGIGLFLACGRIGCLMVGCCHGRPCGWGICYSRDHEAAGFPAYLVGVRLFPIQAVESIFVLFVVAFGVALVFWGYPPGSSLVLYVVAYGIGRFWFEFARGDEDRPYLWGFSQAQWISLLLAIAVVASEWKRILPVAQWHWAAAVALGASLLLVSLWRHLDRSRKFELLHPRHVREIITALDHVKLAYEQPSLLPEPSLIHVVHTSLGYRISAGQSATGSRTVRHYSVSQQGSPLPLKTAQMLSRLIARVERGSDSFQLIQGNTGVFHIIFDCHGARFD